MPARRRLATHPGSSPVDPLSGAPSRTVPMFPDGFTEIGTWTLPANRANWALDGT
jgi:hypothetical protein